MLSDKDKLMGFKDGAYSRIGVGSGSDTESPRVIIERMAYPAIVESDINALSTLYGEGFVLASKVNNGRLMAYSITPVNCESILDAVTIDDINAMGFTIIDAPEAIRVVKVKNKSILNKAVYIEN